MERYGADWTYDTLKRCRFFYQSYANTSIGATPLPQLENPAEEADSKEVANWRNSVAPFQYSDFPLMQVPLAELEKDEILQVALAENDNTPILQVPLAKLEKDGEIFVQVPLAQITWYHHISLSNLLKRSNPPFLQ
ncbi:MAG: hypothetical protein IJ882_03620 [Paludibacteraceae bacterium]|nr:hypothetical protein [Paludibacteraceae bacterium]